MKRTVIFILAMGMILVGFFMDPAPAQAGNTTGNHYIKGKVIAIESCDPEETGSSENCLGIIETVDRKHTARITGDIEIGRQVYLECRIADGETECNNQWSTSVGERYVNGGEISDIHY